MYMLAAGAAVGAIGALGSLKDLFSSSPPGLSNAPAATDRFAIGTGSGAPAAGPTAGAGWSYMTSETMSAMISAQSQASAGAASHGGGRASQYFAMLDADRDETVSKDELSAALTPSGHGDKTDALLTKLDSDNDGAVSLNELRQALRESRHRQRLEDRADETTGADGSTGKGGPLQNATSKTVTNSDGSTTTTISYADGSSVSMTRPAAPSDADANANRFASTMLERLIQRQAQMLSATTAGQALSLSA